MTEFFGNVVAGVADGAVISLLAFAIVLLFKSTGVANFGEGVVATMSVFVFYEIDRRLHHVGWALLVSAVAVVAIGGLAYVLVIMPRQHHADGVNVLMRTIGLFLLLPAVINLLWSAGQPFTIHSVVPLKTAFSISGVAISWLAVATVGLLVALGLVFAAIFRWTRTGLLFLGLADRGDVARLLGAPTKALAALAWMTAGVIGLLAGLGIAPGQLLTTGMTDNYLLYAFTAAVIGGLTSLVGSMVGGVIVGVVADVVSAYWGVDASTMAVFALILVALAVRPSGLFGTRVLERI